MKRLSSRENRLCAILCNAVLIAMEVVAAISCTISLGWEQFQYYTQDSNYFALIVSVIFLIVACRAGRNAPLPRWLILLRYIATCLLSVTFLVVVFILAPPYGLEGYRIMLLSEVQVFEHLLCPVLSFLSLILFEDTPKQKGASFLALIPTFIYAIVAVSLNFAKIWNGPYFFLCVYEQPWWKSVLYAIIIPLACYFTGFFLLFALKKRGKKGIKA